MTTYGQFCPVAKAMELLDERWTLLVVRELLAGSTHFNELRRGNPRISPALLTKRLRTLERAQVVTRHRDEYRLTPSGEELRSVVEALGAWGSRWIGELGTEDLDPHLLMWDLKRTVPTEAWPTGCTVVAFEFPDLPARRAHWWLVVRDGQADVCDYDPGYDVTATVRGALVSLVRVWRGDRSWTTALTAGELHIEAPTTIRRRLPGWVGQSRLAAVPRPRAGDPVGA